jgi:hypothetical protein
MNDRREGSPMREWRSFVLALTTAVLTPRSALALPITASFTATDFTPANPPDPDVSGSFDATFDISGLTGIGFEGFDGTVTSVSLTIDSLVFGVGDVGAFIAYEDGNLLWVWLGTDIVPNPGGGGCLVASENDDFCAEVRADGGGFLLYSIGGIGDWDASTYSSTLTVVPEPSTTLLLALGLAGLAAMRQRGAAPRK